MIIILKCGIVIWWKDFTNNLL